MDICYKGTSDSQTRTCCTREMEKAYHERVEEDFHGVLEKSSSYLKDLLNTNVAYYQGMWALAGTKGWWAKSSSEHISSRPAIKWFLSFQLFLGSFLLLWLNLGPIGSILNPSAGKCFKDTQKKGKGTKTGISRLAELLFVAIWLAKG